MPTIGTDPTRQASDANTVIKAANGARIVLATAAQIERLPKCDSVIGVDISHAAILAENAVIHCLTWAVCIYAASRGKNAHGDMHIFNIGSLP